MTATVTDNHDCHRWMLLCPVLLVLCASCDARFVINPNCMLYNHFGLRNQRKARAGISTPKFGFRVMVRSTITMWQFLCKQYGDGRLLQIFCIRWDWWQHGQPSQCIVSLIWILVMLDKRKDELSQVITRATAGVKRIS